MKLITKIVLLLIMLSYISQDIFAQSDLQIFGFFQAALSKNRGNVSVVGDMPTPLGIQKIILEEDNPNETSAEVQQLNLFFRKELTSTITSWIDLEFINNYNSVNDWGSFSLSEAWVNYQHSDAFNIKAGLIIPKFGYLNEIKNRMTLLPYITRPVIFETAISHFDQSVYVPQIAFAQLSGIISIKDFSLDYAAYVGNSGKDYISTNASQSSSGEQAGVDTTDFKLFGGRIGMKYSDFRAGFSASFDKANYQKDLKEDVPRTRIAVDAGLTLYNFELEGEYISVNLYPKNTTDDLSNHFYYATLTYNFSEQLFAYGSYSFIRDKADEFFSGGLKGITIGAGFRPVDAILLKAGYTNFFANSNFNVTIDPQIPPISSTADINLKLYQLAIAILF